jgi:glucosylceramidase
MKQPFVALFVALLVVIAAPALRAASWTLYETARDTDRRLAQVPVQSAKPGAPSASAGTITLAPARRFQEMLGFGGALTESAAWVLAQLPADKRAEVLRRYYDPVEGIGYTLARTHMNSCDFSLNIWSLDDTPGDYHLRDFSLKRMRKWMLPLIREARDIAGHANFKLKVSPWSPPAWMKTNNRMDDGGKLRPAYRGAWAGFFVRFAQAMRDEENIPVWAFSIQNEPEAHTPWENCLYTAGEARDFARDYLVPALKKAGFLDGPGAIKLIGWDHNRNHLEARADVLLGEDRKSVV